MSRKKFSAIAVLLALVIMLSSCAKPSEVAPEQNSPEPEPTQPTEPVVTEEVKKVFTSGLTGLEVENEAAANRRPVAIMINNIKKALPQYGISRAGVVFEALAEGGITRLLAVFDDISDIEQIGSVRSARHYYIDLAQSLDAVFVHIGGSPQAYDELKERDIDSYDLIDGNYSSMGWRDKERIKTHGYEHSVFTSGERIEQRLEKDGVRTTRDANYSKAFNFSEDAVYEGNDATKISAEFSSYKTGTYTYDEKTGLYLLGQYGKAHMDELYDTQLGFKNIFVIYMNSYMIKGDDKGRLDFDTTGSGKGTYFVNGTATEFTWKRDSEAAPFKLYTTDGTELPVVPGDNYVAIVPTDAEVTVEGAEASSEVSQIAQ